jgi:hypothetical protein
LTITTPARPLDHENAAAHPLDEAAIEVLVGLSAWTSVSARGRHIHSSVLRFKIDPRADKTESRFPIKEGQPLGGVILKR